MMATGQYPILRYGTDPWEIFRVFLLKNTSFFLHQEGWSLQITELNSFTTPEKLWLREELLEGWAAHGAVFPAAVFPAAGQLAGSTALATKTGMCNSMSFFGNEVGGGYQS